MIVYPIIKIVIFQVDLTKAPTRELKIFLLVTLLTLIGINAYLLFYTPLQTVQNKMLIELQEPLWNQDIDFETFNQNNDTGTLNGCYVVPNYIHFVKFGRKNFTYLEMIVVLAALKNQKPDKIFFHRDHNDSFEGKYWTVISNLKALTDIVVYTYVERPTEIFGQKLGWPLFHGSDVTRIRMLMKYGGIFLDSDSYIIKSLDTFRKYEMSIGWEENQMLGNQVLIAHKNARFLNLWLESYRNAYKGDKWYYNAGERSTKEILWKRPELVHRVKISFGIATGHIYVAFKENNNNWKNFYTIHLLARHQYMLKNLTATATFPVTWNESNIAYYPINFRTMAYDVYDFGNISWPKTIKT